MAPPQPMTMVLVMLLAVLLSTNIRADEVATDRKTLCQNVKCSTDCPSDSELQDHPQDTTYTHDEEIFLDRIRRAIAMHKIVHAPIQIIPSDHRHLHKRSLTNTELVDVDLSSDATYTDQDLQEMCCPKCVCKQPCVPNCPNPSVDPYRQTNQPGSCCSHIDCPMGCQTESKEFHEEGKTWNENACTKCRCTAGQVRCEISSCKPLNCPNTKYVEGECCPVCDETKSIFCLKKDVNCELSCLHGFERRGDCALCSCARPTNATHSTTAGSVTETTTPLSTTDGSHEKLDTYDGASTEYISEVEGDIQTDGFPWGMVSPLLIILVVVLLVAIVLFVRYKYSNRTWKLLQLLKSFFGRIPNNKQVYNRVASTAPVASSSSAGTVDNMA